MPDLHIILYANTDVILGRINQRQEAKDIYETSDIVTQANIKYRSLGSYIENVCYVDSTMSKEEVLNEAIKIINVKLKEMGYE